MAVTETYVDPAIAANSGSGTIGDPYGDLQFALDSMTRDATNGDRLNIKAGTDEVLVAALDLTAYGTPATNQPLIFQGYTSVADDGGIGGIDANANSAVYDSNVFDFVHFIGLNLHNSGVGDRIIRVDDQCQIINCNLFDGSSVPLLSTGNHCKIIGCFFENGSNDALQAAGTGIKIMENTFRNGASEFTAAIRASGVSTVIENNILILSGPTSGIVLSQTQISVRNNSIFSVAGTASGIASTANHIDILNNIIEGFSGVGGIAINSSKIVSRYGHNKFFNNTTDEAVTNVIVNLGNNDTLAASAFLDAASDDFRVTISVKALAYPIANFPDLTVRTFLDVGALQRLEGATVVVPPVGVSLGRLFNVPAEDRIYEVLT